MFNEDILKEIIFKKIKMLNVENFVLEEDKSLEEQFGLDSMQMVEIVVEIEEQFKITMDYDVLIDAMSSYGKLKKYIKSLCG